VFAHLEWFKSAVGVESRCGWCQLLMRVGVTGVGVYDSD